MSRRLQSRLNRQTCVGYDPREQVAVRAALRNGFDRNLMEGQTAMDVSGIGSVSGATPARAVGSPQVTQPATAPSVDVQRDELEISTASKMLDRLSESPEVRAERLAQIKEAIEAGVYDTDEKLEAALARMMDSMGIDLDNE